MPSSWVAMAAARSDQALTEWRLAVRREQGRTSVLKEFLLRLGELPPAGRRLALARACAQPWAGRPEEMPAPFERELMGAMREARGELAARPDMDAMLDDLFASGRALISECLLREVMQMTPAKRLFSLLFSFAAEWSEGEPCPEWLRSDLEHARCAAREENRAGRETDRAG